MLYYLKSVLENMPNDWLKLTTHRLDIYNESLAKTEFLDQFIELYEKDDASSTSLRELPTAYDYIRLGHPLSSVLEWAVAELNGLSASSVISFDSVTTPVMAVLRKNLLNGKNTQIVYTDALPDCFEAETLRTVYGYRFEVKQVNSLPDVQPFEGSTVFISSEQMIGKKDLPEAVDFFVGIYGDLGSIILVNGKENRAYVSEIQHVRRRETIAMTPSNCYKALQLMLGGSVDLSGSKDRQANKERVLASIKKITGADTNALIASSGLSTQYAIVIGLIDHALGEHPGKNIKIIVPPNCYGGTNDQARRVAACISNVEVLDMPVDGDNDMVQSIDKVLGSVAAEDAVPFIIAEIPTNPRVEVPDLEQLRSVLTKERRTNNGSKAIDPVFILDQTFCPNVYFLREEDILADVRTISYVSGSKFPSGGKCTAGYCVANKKAESLMKSIEKHLVLCDNEATDLQLEFLAEQMPSMNQRIADAYKNTREFVNFIKEVLPTAKINFVSEALAAQGFTPSVFSLDLPTKGSSDEEREMYKRELNNRLITMMITKIPEESKYCVSYGQLKGCYWTIPATSTQGTTKEGDKDYIARVALSANMDMDMHKKVFQEFVDSL